jgi:disulfide bond formation protein DsbB
MIDILTLNTMLGWGTVLLQLATLGLLVVYVMRHERLEAYLVRYGFPLIFLATLVSTFLTLIYSEYFGVIPCGLCWLQRVFLYPQVIMVFVAWIKRDYGVSCYSIPLSVAGLVVALYQHALQMGMSSPLPCPASGEADCAKRIVFELGYITFPLMAASFFAFLIVYMLILRRARV